MRRNNAPLTLTAYSPAAPPTRGAGAGAGAFLSLKLNSAHAGILPVYEVSQAGVIMLTHFPESANPISARSGKREGVYAKRGHHPGKEEKAVAPEERKSPRELLAIWKLFCDQADEDPNSAIKRALMASPKQKSVLEGERRGGGARPQNQTSVNLPVRMCSYRYSLFHICMLCVYIHMHNTCIYE